MDRLRSAAVLALLLPLSGGAAEPGYLRLKRVQIIDRHGLRQVSDAGAIEALVDAVIAAQPAVVAEFRAGKEKAFNALVGHVMKASKGKANPGEVNAMLRRKLAG